MGSDFFNGGNADGGKIDIKAKTIKVDTGKGNTIKVTMSYGEQSTLEELLIAYLGQIAVYLRLSNEDEFVKDESNSITNQRAFIRGFINKNEELRKMRVVEFVDDGYFGKNMNRPDMQRMLEMVKRKQISCVIVKDFSKFSRDHIEQGKYIKQIFPFMGVRFIAINDNYDSADYVGGIGEIDVAFKGILYDFFSEEQSSKVSLTLDTKRGNGKYIATYAPYGYVKSPEDKHKLVVDEFASQIVKRIFKEFLSGKSMYKISEGLNRDGIDTPGVYIAIQVGSEKQLARYREKKPLWNNVAIGRILGNEQYTGTMVYSRFKSENVGDKHAKALPEDEWKRVENCHEAIVSKADFEKVAAMRKGNTCASAKRKHETHCLTGKMICGNCGHRLSHTYAGRPKYYCANHYLDKTDEKCNISVLDADMESVVKKALQMMIDVLVDSRNVVDMQREKQAERLKQAEKHLSDMEHSRELIEKDLREAYESYKLEMTDKETYLEQRKTYEQMLERLQENIEEQMAAVTKMADMDVPEVAGLEMLEGQLKLTGLNREMVDAFVEEIVVYAKDRVKIKWKFRDEFGEVGKARKH